MEISTCSFADVDALSVVKIKAVLLTFLSCSVVIHVRAVEQTVGSQIQQDGHCSKGVPPRVT